MSKRRIPPHLNKESGVVLITGLIFLMVLTMIVISALRTGNLEERMAGNSRNRQIALQSNEAVLRDAEEQLFTSPDFKSKFDTPTSDGNGFYVAPVAGSTARWQTIDWTSSTATQSFATTLALSGVDSAPRFIVEIITPPSRTNSAVPCSKGVATVTTRGAGKDGAIVFTQATYRYFSDRAADGCS
jgi:type IV pilus assembly protein PilX